MMKKTLVLCGLALMVLGCSHPKEAQLIPAEKFKTEVDGKAVGLYTLKAGDISLQITNFGARNVTLFTPDRKGNMEDIVVGHNTIEEYVHPAKERFFGAVVGPVANRIGGASFTIGDTTYHTPANDNKVNTLHGGLIGLDNVVWDVVSSDDKNLVLHYLHPDGLEGYPGNLDITMSFSVNDQNEFKISYEATTDKVTPVNISYHPFFNLRGEGVDTVEDYLMYIKASHFIPIDPLSIPTGEIADVTGTPFDFRTEHTIGQMIGQDNEQLKNARGYDHNWCLDKEKEGVELVCTVYDPQTGRELQVLTDQPGMQFYSGNFFSGSTDGKSGRPLSFRSSLALETQFYPDSPNQPAFPSVLLEPGKKYTHTCIYKFGVRK